MDVLPTKLPGPQENEVEREVIAEAKDFEQFSEKLEAIRDDLFQGVGDMMGRGSAVVERIPAGSTNQLLVQDSLEPGGHVFEFRTPQILRWGGGFLAGEALERKLSVNGNGEETSEIAINHATPFGGVLRALTIYIEGGDTITLLRLLKDDIEFFNSGALALSAGDRQSFIMKVDVVSGSLLTVAVTKSGTSSSMSVLVNGLFFGG